MTGALLERPRTTTFTHARVGDTIGDLSFDPNEAVRLGRLDLDQRRKELARNLEGFKGEVLDDLPISHTYHYYFDGDGVAYNHPDRLPIHRFDTQFDPRERDGAPQRGFEKATQILFHNPDTTVFWYSPAGPASLDPNPDNPYHGVPFIYGQLYVMAYDGEKINGVAVKVDPQGEEAIQQFLPTAFAEAASASSDYDRILQLIQHPVAFAGGPSELSGERWSDGIVYRGKAESGALLTVTQLLDGIQNRLSGDASHSTMNEFDHIVNRLDARALGDKNVIARLYLQMILNHSTTQSNGKISLMGACGGSEVTRGHIEELLNITNEIPGSISGAPSSQFRMMTQGDLLQRVLQGTTESQHFVCPNCKAKAEGPVGNQCPSCKVTREEWAKKGNEVC